MLEVQLPRQAHDQRSGGDDESAIETKQRPENYSDPALVNLYDSFEAKGLALSEWHVGYPAVFDAVRRNCDGSGIQGKRLLDFGCGSGNQSVLWAKYGAIVTGVDQSPNMIEQAQGAARRSDEASSVRFKLVQPETRLPFAEEMFDVVNANFVLCTYPEKSALAETIGEFYRLLTPGGICVVLHSNWDDSHGTDFASFRLPLMPNLTEGQEIKPLLKGEKWFEVRDFFWPKQELCRLFRLAGFNRVQVQNLYKLDRDARDFADRRFDAERRKSPFYLLIACKGEFDMRAP